MPHSEASFNPAHCTALALRRFRLRARDRADTQRSGLTRTTSSDREDSKRFIVLFGVVSLFADLTSNSGIKGLVLIAEGCFMTCRYLHS